MKLFSSRCRVGIGDRGILNMEDAEEEKRDSIRCLSGSLISIISSIATIIRGHSAFSIMDIEGKTSSTL
ncbi:MAG: hypothetical protein LBC52_00200 [Treponema sp.]|jgi:hypothetical protein|nr:hypothetical protein [Treponema sp.]